MREPESDALARALAPHPERFSSVLSRVELLRAVRKSGLGRMALRRARGVLSRVVLIDFDEEVIELAATLDPPTLRSLDAVHLASALSIGPEVTVFTYDRRVVEAGALHRLHVQAPS